MTRHDYMQLPHEKRNHHDFYAQFVTESCKLAVLSIWGIDALLNSTDPHMNDLPLSTWDRMHFPHDCARLFVSIGGQKGVSLSDKVCVMKTAARIVIAEHEAS